MKKILLTALILLGLTPCLQGQKNVSLEDIERGWKSKPIENVQNGSIGLLLEAFDMTWPTYVTADARSVMEQGLSQKVLDPETGYRVTVDAKNAYVEVTDDGTDGLYMSACVWNRDNGHQLFAIMIGKPTDPNLEVVCFYDYNPQTKRMTPEPNILSDFQRQGSESQIAHKLPRKGKELVIIEYDLPFIYAHHFEWNGMQPVFDRVDLDRELMKAYDESPDESFPVSFKGKKPEISDFVTAILSRDELGEALGAMSQIWQNHLKGKALPKNQKITVDTKNGYVRYDAYYENNEHSYIEFCYWNCADGKHKLIGENVSLLVNGEPVETELTGLSFYWYDNDSRKMCYKYAFELGEEVEAPEGTTGRIHNLPRQGKTIEYIFSTPKGKVTKKMTWNGKKFVKN